VALTLPAPPRIDVPDEGDDGSEDGNDTALMDALDSKYFVMVKLIVCSPCLIAALCSGLTLSLRLHCAGLDPHHGQYHLVRSRIFHTHVHDDGQIHTFAGQCEPDLSIFEADFARSQWVKVTTLADNQALFLEPCSRAVCLPQGDSPGNHVWSVLG
jgi:hypothetical protein